MHKSEFLIKSMDCPSEIKIIETLFDGDKNIHQIEFHLERQTVIFFHQCPYEYILKQLKLISLPGELLSIEDIDENQISPATASVESKTLKKAQTSIKKACLLIFLAPTSP